MNDEYDVIVVGGGPAGATAAGLVAEKGHRTLLLEREKMPRFHVGESLMPECYWPLERLGLTERMKSSKFTKKKSVQFVTANGKESAPFYFHEHDPRESSTTWQVERADFDKMLFDRAGELGADCFDAARVLDVLFDENQAAHGVRVRTADGQTKEVSARVVMDGSGQQSLIANKLGLREDIPNLKKAAIWSYYKNAQRDEGDNGGATIIMHTTAKDSWFWFIPLSDGVTSIGCVGDSDYMLKTGLDPEARYEQELDRCPGLKKRLENAERVDKIHVAKEYSYWTHQHAGDGWVLIGDAFGFIDPLYSSGVYFALVMGERAADAVSDGLSRQDTSAAQLGSWCEGFKEGSTLIRKLVEAFYTKEFSFGGFIKDNPQFEGNLTDLLIGRIFYDGAGEIFEKMEPAVEHARATSNV
ncbi:MAG TPA: NAD(P)/FAD-dependent oxidoreductase [Planctomycetaceae bacterium]|nr:NAD(P)/FAD-dependent oxidoreductase [Planctomycetaceae bacterium]